MKCRKCNSSTIKSRSNSSHGSKSKKIVSMECKQCGSMDIEPTPKGRFNRRR